MPTIEGIFPENWLWRKFIIIKLVRLLISEGISPVSWFSTKPRVVRFIGFPISGGMGPDILLKIKVWVFPTK